MGPERRCQDLPTANARTGATYAAPDVRPHPRPSRSVDDLGPALPRGGGRRARHAGHDRGHRCCGAPHRIGPRLRVVAELLRRGARSSSAHPTRRSSRSTDSSRAGVAGGHRRGPGLAAAPPVPARPGLVVGVAGRRGAGADRARRHHGAGRPAPCCGRRALRPLPDPGRLCGDAVVAVGAAAGPTQRACRFDRPGAVAGRARRRDAC